MTSFSSSEKLTIAIHVASNFFAFPFALVAAFALVTKAFESDFSNFVEIKPNPIMAADKCAFHAIGKGDMLIDIPNSDTTSNILLKDVLYAPSMGVTLVSISHIATTGSTVIFSGDNCRIFNNLKSLLGKIEMSQGLYHVYSAHEEPAGYAGRVKELLTIDKLHHHLRHVVHEAAKKLVEDGLVKGVKLDEESKPTVCVSCE